MSTEYAVAKAQHKAALTRASQMLLGLVTGIVADGHLHDMEVQMINTWLSENSDVASVWPGSAIAAALRTALADGVISQAERERLLKELQALVGSDFSETGSTTPAVVALPYDTDTALHIEGAGICHTGEFLYGTRAACERLTEKAGGIALGTVTKKVNYLVIGTHVSPHWVNTSYGRKIEQAMQLKDAGHGISIIAEQHWLDACRS